MFFHELGHFVLAKKNGIDVEEFAIGMGPLLYSREYKGTKYAVRILPIGGFCAMGEDEEATDSPNSFNNKSVWARISVIAAGPIFYFILALVFAVIQAGDRRGRAGISRSGGRDQRRGHHRKDGR